MDRRTFLRFGAVAGAAAAIDPPLAGAAQSGAELGFELEEATIGELQRRMAEGSDTAESLAEKYLARVEALDRRGPALRSLLETNSEALSIARSLDRERRGGKIRGPLHGIPLLLKDNIATADRMSTSAGSLALEGIASREDSFLVRRLRSAGAVILGKTNLSEWANFRSTHSSSGWSGRGGQCANPYALDRNPSGSSSGSAAAVAANFAAAALGSETDGSIVSPASICGIVGVKPTLGLVSRSGIVPIAHSQDTAGPMARCVADAAVLLAAIAGFDGADGSSAKAPFTPDAFARLDPNSLRGARLGVVRKAIFKNNPATDRVAESALAELKKLGAVLVDPADVETIEDLGKSEIEVLLYEFKADLNAYLARLGPAAPVRSLKELIEFNRVNRDREMPFFEQELFERAEAKGPLTEPAYREALAADLKGSREKGLDATLDKHRLEALVCPTGAPAWMTDLVNGDNAQWGSSTLPAVAGYPHVTVPMGFVFGLPVGLSFIGRAWSEPKLLNYAYAYEQATKHRRPPKFLPSANLNL